MPIPMPHYAKIKDRYCICYFGSCNEYVVQLIHLIPHIEKQLPGIEIYLCCKQELSYLVSGHSRIFFQSEIHVKKNEFAHIRVLNCNLIDHPIMQLFTESDLTIPTFPTNSTTTKCVVYPRGILPTTSLSPSDVNKVKEQFRDRGFNVQIEGSLEGAGWVVGVENEQLYQAGFNGIKTSLVPTGIGTEFYERLFGNEILHL